MAEYIEPLLSQLLVDESKAYNKVLIGSKLFPMVTVHKPESKYPRYDRATALHVPDTKLASDGEANEDTSKATMVDFSTVEHALRRTIPGDKMQFADGPFKVEPRRVSRSLMKKLELAKEKEIADLVKNLTDRNQALSGDGTTKTNVWSGSGGAPLEIAEDARNAMLMEPNVLILSKSVFNKLSEHPDILEKLPSSSHKVADKKDLALIFKVDEVWVPDGQANMGALKQDESANTSQIWGDVFIYAHVDLSDDLETVCVGKTAMLKYKEANAGHYVVRQWRKKEGGVLGKDTVNQVGCSYKVLMQCPELIYCLKDVL